MYTGGGPSGAHATHLPLGQCAVCAGCACWFASVVCLCLSVELSSCVQVGALGVNPTYKPMGRAGL